MTAPPGPAVIRAHGLTRRFPPTTWALREASLEIRPGDTVAIVGPSGSGKSTLLALMGLLDSPTSGDLTIGGVDVTEASDKVRTAIRREQIGFVFQAFHLIPHLTVRENVLFGLGVKGIEGAAARARADEYLDRVGLRERSAAFPATLSGGEQQRTAIARAIASEPPLVLCDEPTGNLDSQNSAVVLEQLITLASPASAVVIVTHEDDVAQRCARTFRVSDGIAQEVSVR
ncbi:ABC transporter ATP-binding protein [Streptomyces sp. AC495_CC817]|uniref:ABC transporter ATP-binding protein n=1 Tax=Streptomyces sp. AC495_CC817 TaxID=2823900 RepID=UPI001C262870|nr:ABC transporter ATP-binding protein [Streptomyces sp. AC495_CC817]